MTTVRSRVHDRRGFVLLAVLWVIVGLVGVGITLMLTGRDAIGSAQNRVSLARAHWLAEGCVAVMRAAADEVLADRIHAEAAWRALDDVIAGARSLADEQCDISMRAAGTTIDVNGADRGTLDRLFLAMHVPVAAADSLVDAIEDWRDADDETRPAGAERAWYVEAHRLPPRNGPIADVRELARVRGLERFAGLDSVLSAEPDRVAIGRAPRPVLAALPGFSDELVNRVIEARQGGPKQLDLLALAGSVSPMARDSLSSHYAEVVPLVAMDPEAWILTVRAHVRGSVGTSAVEVRLGRADARVNVLRHRSWP